MLKVQNLSVKYGNTEVVKDVSLSLDEDEILMLVGPTGCGKTTILQSLAGLIPIANGSIALNHWTATPKQPVPPEKRNVGMVFQDFALFPHLTVEQNVTFRLKDSKLADEWLELLGLSNFRKAKPDRLSGGQKQRVALARTLAHEPAYVLLDEPLSNLDAALKDSLRWEIRDALKTANVPAIWVTHDQEEALSIGDRVGVLKDGLLEQLDTPETCFSKPANRFVARFLGEASFVEGQVDAKENNTQNKVATKLGTVNGTPIAGAQGNVDLLVRPDDIVLESCDGSTGNGEVARVRYEGGTKLCKIDLANEESVAVRVSHESSIKPGDKVNVAIVSSHPLAYFAR